MPETGWKDVSVPFGSVSLARVPSHLMVNNSLAWRSVWGHLFFGLPPLECSIGMYFRAWQHLPGM